LLYREPSEKIIYQNPEQIQLIDPRKEQIKVIIINKIILIYHDDFSDKIQGKGERKICRRQINKITIVGISLI
jgi:hypothetical protein